MDVEVEKPHVHHPVGHRKLDLILPIAALFVSFVSILIAYHHGSIMKELVAQNERLVQANSLPYLDYRVRRTTRGEGNSEIAFVLSNGGIGPAAVQTVELWAAGRPISSARHLLDEFKIPAGQLSAAPLVHRMVRPGETVEFFKLTGDPAIAEQVSRMLDLAGRREFQLRICYCSVFEDCWVIDQQGQKPRPARQCPAPKVPYEPLLLSDYRDTVRTGR